MTEELINPTPEQDKNNPVPMPIWGVVANVLKDHAASVGGKEVRRGTRKFNGGAKVYLVRFYYGGDKVVVIGHFRGRGHVTTVLSITYLENFRAELIYSPTVQKRLADKDVSHVPQDGSEESQQLAETVAAQANETAAHFRIEKVARQAQTRAKDENPTDTSA